MTALLDAMAPMGQCDLVEHLSAELPLFTLSEILGIPESDRPKLVRWMHFLEIAGYIVAEKNFGSVDPNFFGEFMSNVQEMFEYGRALLLKRRAEPREDLLTALAQAKVAGRSAAGRISRRVVAADRVRRQRHDAQFDLGDDEAADGVRAREGARAGEPDAAADDGGRGHPDGVARHVYAAHGDEGYRDSRAEDRRGREGDHVLRRRQSRSRGVCRSRPFRCRRAPNGKDHVAFGIGPHVCLGQRVANMQLEAVYRQIFTRFPDMHWTGEIDIAPNNFVHAIRKLGVEFTPEKRRAADRMTWEDDIEELRRRQALAREMGGEERVAKHRSLGKLTVRERIEALLDPGFVS